LQRVFYFVQFERLNNSFNFFHGLSPARYLSFICNIRAKLGGNPRNTSPLAAHRLYGEKIGRCSKISQT
jgi:hypothetical protein